MLVRTDLSLPQIAVQACHASLEVGRDFLPVGTPNIVLCGVCDESALLAAAVALDTAGVSHRVFREPDIGNQATAIATTAVSGSVRKLFRKFKCLKEKDMQSNQVQVSQEAEGCYKSRWGYHAVDYTTWKKIKALRNCYEQILQRNAAIRRWHAKRPENRVIYSYRRNAANQRIGVSHTTTMPEPRPLPIMQLASTRLQGLALSKATRYPSETPVAKLSLESLAMVNELYDTLQRFRTTRVEEPE